MNKDLYDQIYRRKSFHLFRNVGKEKLTKKELDDIKIAYYELDSLYPNIKTDIRIVKAEKLNIDRNAEYCLLIYSEEKDNYLINAGYIGEQLDLYLTKNNIGSLWFGIGKPDKQVFENKKYVIMLLIHKVKNDSMFRKDMFKSKRKSLEETWKGNDLGVANIVRFAPSACNSQPWKVVNKDDLLTVYRYKKEGKRGIMPARLVSYFNRIDIGIYLCFLDLCLDNQKIKYKRKLFIDEGLDKELTKVAEYKLK